MNSITLRFGVKPKAIQSVRIGRCGGFARAFQPQENVNWKVLISMMARQQIPEGFKVFDEVPLKITVVFSYLPPKSWPKYRIKALENGFCFRKITKPDLSDNLMKGLCDALTGIVWRDDSIIASIVSDKYYATTEEITIKVEPLDEMFKQGTANNTFEW